MKRVIAIILLLVTLSILLTGCGVYEVNSLDEYKEKIAEDEYGFSEFEIDHPKYVLPSCTFWTITYTWKVGITFTKTLF